METQKKYPHAGHRQRLRERFCASAESLADDELLELLLFYSVPLRDTHDLARRLIAACGSLGAVLDAPEEQLLEIPGVGDATVTLLRCLGRIRRRKPSRPPWNAKDAGAEANALFPLRESDKAPKERIELLGLDDAQRICGRLCLGEGDSHSASLDSQRLKQFMASARPKYVILCHNHPSRVGVPSHPDFLSTDSLQEEFARYGAILIDHFVFDEAGDYTSMDESEVLRACGVPPDYADVLADFLHRCGDHLSDAPPLPFEKPAAREAE